MTKILILVMIETNMESERIRWSLRMYVFGYEKTPATQWIAIYRTEAEIFGRFIFSHSATYPSTYKKYWTIIIHPHLTMLESRSLPPVLTPSTCYSNQKIKSNYQYCSIKNMYCTIEVNSQNTNQLCLASSSSLLLMTISIFVHCFIIDCSKYESKLEKKMQSI